MQEESWEPAKIQGDEKPFLPLLPQNTEWHIFRNVHAFEYRYHYHINSTEHIKKKAFCSVQNCLQNREVHEFCPEIMEYNLPYWSITNIISREGRSSCFSKGPPTPCWLFLLPLSWVGNNGGERGAIDIMPMPLHHFWTEPEVTESHHTTL